MIEILPNLYIGSQIDAEGFDGAIVSCCKDPSHRQMVGYTSRALPKDHPEYLFAIRGNRLALNIVDADKPEFFTESMINTALDFISARLAEELKVLVHCNQGQSRSPSLGLLYIRDSMSDDFEAAEKEFRKIYPDYNPRNGIREYVRAHWREMD